MVEQIKVGGFDENFSYVIHNGREAAVVDPSGDIEKVFEVIERKNLETMAILITHSHFDHVDRLNECLTKYPAPMYMHADARERIDIDTDVRTIGEGDTIDIGTLAVKVLHTPGHISDAVCFYIEEKQSLITGDTLFVEGCGRVGSEHDAELLYESLQRLKQLPDETNIFPGHDYGSKPHSTIAHEKARNRFFLAPDLAAFKKERLG